LLLACASGVVGDRIDRTRSVALKALLNILHTSKLAKHIHGYPFLMRLVEEVELRHAITICCLNITITIWVEKAQRSKNALIFCQNF
jgi:hypothetical protein